MRETAAVNMAEKRTNQDSAAEQNPNAEKKMTKYDLKMQRRREEEEKAKKKKAWTKAICGVIIVFIVALIGWNVYDKYQEKNGPYVAIGEHKVKKAEFDYYYYTSLNSFASNYGSYLSYFGLDVSKPLDQQNYSDTMTWQDYFQQQAASQLQSVYALNDEAAANGFEYDAAKDYNTFVASIESEAEEQGVTAEEYCQSLYGKDATIENLEAYVKAGSTASAYYDSIKDATEITDDEINTYYNDNKASYDSVDYRILEVKANMPEEKSETVAESTSETEVAETETMTAEESEAAEAEKQAAKDAAMAEAKAKADQILASITDEASFEAAYKTYAEDATVESLNTNKKQNTISPSDVAAWLFDDARQVGDKTVIEYTAGNSYYVVYFLNRYLDHAKTVDVRHILIPSETTTDEDTTEATEEAKKKAEEIYAQWQNGEATEDSFAELAKVYSEDTGSKENGGLYEAVTQGQMVGSFNDWIFDTARKPGDTDIVETNYGYHIMYFVGDNAEEWYADIKNTLLSNKMNEYMTNLTEAVEVKDVRGELKYLKETESESESETAKESDASETVAESLVETVKDSASETVEETKAN